MQQLDNNNQQQSEQSPSVGKTVAKQAGKKLTRQVLKKLGKKAILVAVKGVLAALKALAAAALSISLPALGITALILLALFLIYMAVTLIFTYDGDALTGKEKEMREYIIEAAANTVDRSKPEQAQYAVPYELIVASLQILDSGKKLGYDKNDVDRVAKTLAPEFEYQTVELKREIKTRSCRTDSEGNKKCSWSSPRTTTFEVEVLTSVITWESIVVYDYEIKEGSWESSGSNKKVKEQSVVTEVQSTEIDYTKFEEAMALDPLNYSTNDKFTVEVLYALTGNPIQYREWKEGSVGFGAGFGSDGGFNGSLLPGSSVPSEYFPIYLAAQKKYGVSWNYIAAIHWVETKFSTIDPMISYVGAEGHTQIMPCTLHGWSYPGCKGSMGYVDVPANQKYKVSTIKKYGGLGVDANNDGLASPWDIEDAIFTTASMLKRAGFKAQAPEKAILSYNHSSKYVSDVMSAAKRFEKESSYISEGGGGIANSAGFVQPATGYVSSGFGWRFGGTDFHQGVDIANNSGTPILSVANGVVSKVISTCSRNTSATCQGTTYGNYVRVKHSINGQSYETLYAHLSAVRASVGQTVTQGQVIGLMGTSGNSTGNHLHFEIHKGSWSWPPTNAINPALLVPLP